MGFVAGDANLHRYVGNDPTNAMDPSGLWTWRLDESGKVIARSEEGDSLNELINQGYKRTTIEDLAKAKGVENPGVKLKTGIEVDITTFFPKNVQSILSLQQQMSYELLRPRVESTEGGPKNVPKGKTVGNCEVDWFQTNELDPATASFKKRAYSSILFGYGNCYGFAALMLDYPLPEGGSPEQFQLRPLKGDGVAGIPANRPQTENPLKDPRDKRFDGVRVVVSEGGIFKTLTGGMKPTNKPGFGAIALFSRDDEISHAGVVLGRNRKGDIMIIQKLNDSRACGISSVTHPAVSHYGEPAFYQK